MSQHELSDDLFHICNGLIESGAVPRSFLSDQVYLHTTLRAHLNLVWDIQKIKAEAAKSKITKPIRLDLWHRDYVETEKTSIDSAYAMSLPAVKAALPAVLGWVPDPDEPSGYEWVFDGAHRLYRAWNLGERTFPAVVLDHTACERCRIPEPEASRLFGGGAYSMGRDIG